MAADNEEYEMTMAKQQSVPLVNNHLYDGSSGHWKGISYRNPKLNDAERASLKLTDEQFDHRDVLNRQTRRYRDLARYISPTFGKPYHLVVQAAPDAQPQGNWRRREVSGDVPKLLKISAWVMGPEEDRKSHIALIIGKSLLATPVVLFLVAVPLGSAPNSSMMYPSFPSRCYEYPKHALNRLDAAPNASTRVAGQRSDDKGKFYEIDGEQKRLLRPRALVVNQNGQWNIVEDGSYSGLYIFISFAANQYQIPAPTFNDPANTVLDKDFIDSRARQLAEQLGVTAYWIDLHCRAEFQPEATDDVHRFCDVVRGAHQVCVVLPDASRQALASFGKRLWCLPEILLSRNHQVLLCHPSPGGGENTELVDIMEMVPRCWAVSRITEDDRIISDGNVETFRLLAEHYTGTLSLSRLELMSEALKALRSREWREFQRGDIAYALMTLLSKRPRMDPTDSEQQALARLSLSNDSDRIVERLACMDQRRVPGQAAWFSTADDLGANLWDIEPLCQVAGVCDDGSIILDGCHGISIRWKNIPRIYFLNRKTMVRKFAGYAARSGPLWFFLAIILLIIGSTKTGDPQSMQSVSQLIQRDYFSSVDNTLKGLGAFFLVVGFLLTVMAPWLVTIIYGGKVWGAKPWLVGFEGTLPLHEIESLTFGDCIGRFTYTPSSGPYCSRQPKERLGADPVGNLGNFPEGQRLFTLIDTGTMTVTVFAAERPPTVALICGKEGGMLRAVLCSYERSTNSLQKECVLRMETPMWDKSRLMGWVKLS